MTSLTTDRILVTGASGHFGRLAVEHLLARLPAGQIVAAMRDPAKGEALAAKGVEVRAADYAEPETLAAALAGIGRVLLVSSSEVGRRAPQHRNVIEAAKAAGVRALAYTSILKGEASPLKLAAEHVETERALAASGIPFAVLRNGWYSENWAGAVPAAVAHSALLGSAGTGRFSPAARSDYAQAAAAVVAAEPFEAGRVYELAGDTSFSLPELAAEIADASARPVAYKDLQEEEYAKVLEGAGLPAPFAATLADADKGASTGALFDDGRTLSRLIGRPTTPWQETLRPLAR